MSWTRARTSAGTTVGGVSGEEVGVGDGGGVVCCAWVDVEGGRVVGGVETSTRELDVSVTGGNTGCDVIGTEEEEEEVGRGWEGCVLVVCGDSVSVVPVEGCEGDVGMVGEGDGVGGGGRVGGSVGVSSSTPSEREWN